MQSSLLSAVQLWICIVNAPTDRNGVNFERPNGLSRMIWGRSRKLDCLPWVKAIDNSTVERSLRQQACSRKD